MTKFSLPAYNVELQMHPNVHLHDHYIHLRIKHITYYSGTLWKGIASVLIMLTNFGQMPSALLCDSISWFPVVFFAILWMYLCTHCAHQACSVCHHHGALKKQRTMTWVLALCKWEYKGEISNEYLTDLSGIFYKFNIWVITSDINCCT